MDHGSKKPLWLSAQPSQPSQTAQAIELLKGGKYKYIRREGTPGNYKYIYADKKGNERFSTRDTAFPGWMDNEGTKHEAPSDDTKQRGYFSQLLHAKGPEYNGLASWEKPLYAVSHFLNRLMGTLDPSDKGRELDQKKVAQMAEYTPEERAKVQQQEQQYKEFRQLHEGGGNTSDQFWASQFNSAGNTGNPYSSQEISAVQDIYNNAPDEVKQTMSQAYDPSLSAQENLQRMTEKLKAIKEGRQNYNVQRWAAGAGDTPLTPEQV